jgi:hypothetical protein
LLLALTWVFSAPAASNKTLTWDASPEFGLVGYKIYYGTASYSYTQTVTVGNVTRATIDGLEAGRTYYFAVTALYGFGEESDFSNEATYVVPNSMVVTLQVIPQADGGIRLTGAGEADHRYQIQATSDFVAWTTLATQVADSGGAFEFIDFAAAAFPIRTYRVQDLGAATPLAAQLEISLAADKTIRLTATGAAGHTYEIQATADFNTWAAIGSRSADNSGAFIYYDADAASLPARFYRLNDLGYAAAAAAALLRISPGLNRVVGLNGAGQIGHTYEIQASTDLSFWMAIGSETADANGEFALTDFEAPNYPARFYRTRDVQP